MKKYLFLIVFVVIIGTIPLFIQYGTYIHCTDFAKQQIPFIMETKRMLLSGKPFWSWNTYYGDNFFGVYGFYTLTSPFVWINCLFPYKYIVQGIFLTLILKYISAFLASSFFLRKMEVSKENAWIGGLLYTFSSYTISNTFYYHFFEPMIVFPLLLYAVERYLRTEKYANIGLVLASFLTIFVNYYFAICSFIATAMYVFVRIIFSNVRISSKSFIYAIGLISLGIALDAFILIPTAMHIMGGPRTSGTILSGLDFTAFPYFIDRLHSLFVPQILEQPTSLFSMSAYNSVSACLQVVGLLLVGLYCWKYKTSWITILVVLSLVAYLTPVNTVFSLFTNPNYTRWAYALELFLILASVKYLDDIKGRILVKQAVVYSLIAMIIFGIALFYGKSNPERPDESREFLISGYSIVLIVNIICLCGFAVFKRNNILIGAIALCAIVQMCFFHYVRSDAYFTIAGDKVRQDITKVYITNNEFEKSDDNIYQYRTASINRYPNLAMLLNRPGVNTSHSIQNNSIRNLICTTDSNNAKVIITADPNCNWRSFYALMSVRDYIEYKDKYFQTNKPELNLDLICQGKSFNHYINKDYIPMGFCYDSYIIEDEIDSINDIKPKQNVPLQLLTNISIKKKDEQILSRYLSKGEVYNGGNIDSIVSERRKIVASKFEGTTKGFTSLISVPRDEVVFFSVPADSGFRARIDNNNTKIYSVNLGLSAVIVPKGTHLVEFSFVPKGLKEGILVSFIAFCIGILVYFRDRLRYDRK